MANQIWVSYLPSFIFKQSIHHTLYNFSELNVTVDLSVTFELGL